MEIRVSWSMRQLVCLGTELTSLEAISQLRNLKSAKLSHNQISDVHKVIFSSKDLYDIDLSHNQVHWILLLTQVLSVSIKWTIVCRSRLSPPTHSLAVLSWDLWIWVTIRSPSFHTEHSRIADGWNGSNWLKQRFQWAVNKKLIRIDWENKWLNYT